MSRVVTCNILLLISYDVQLGKCGKDKYMVKFNKEMRTSVMKMIFHVDLNTNIAQIEIF